MKKQISNYLLSLGDKQQKDMMWLHERISKLQPELSFFDGKDAGGKVVSNPQIGYGKWVKSNADGSVKTLFKVGISANSRGISVYIMGLEDKNYLKETYGESLGKAKVTGYCIQFAQLKDVQQEVLLQIIAEHLSN